MAETELCFVLYPENYTPFGKQKFSGNSGWDEKTQLFGSWKIPRKNETSEKVVLFSVDLYPSKALFSLDSGNLLRLFYFILFLFIYYYYYFFFSFFFCFFFFGGEGSGSTLLLFILLLFEIKAKNCSSEIKRIRIVLG